VTFLDMAPPRVADGRDGLQLDVSCEYRISSRGQTTRGGPPVWGLGVGLTTPHRKKQIRYEKDQRASDLDGFFL
jgi:hypothetical protein